jgi:uncharacterized membrane protein
MQTFERYLERWRGAGLIDDATEASIRAWEAGAVRPGGRRWQVVLALILGGILLGAGVLLFVAAHWDDVSPGWRLTLVLGMLALFHVAGLAARERFEGFATAMHGVGTVAAGGAIALVGQIFNMQEHWPGAVLLWALCAVAGWWLLRDQFQQVLALLLVPGWVVSEWSERANVYDGSEVYLTRVIAVIAAVYLAAFLHSRRRVVFGILFAAAGIALAVCMPLLAEGWEGHIYGREWGYLPLSLRVAAFVIMAGCLVAAWIWSRQSAAVVGAVLVTSFVLPWTVHFLTNGLERQRYYTSEPGVLAYVLVAALTVFLVWWGVREVSKPLVNYGIVAFALTVMWFYFSSVMDKLGRSLGLIALGVLFLAGGWLLETMRRRLVAKMGDGAEVAL